MKIVVVHNFYRGDGGEDRVFEDEVALLASHGHDVVQFTEHNSSIDDRSKLAVALGTVWNRRAARELREVVRRRQADIVHFHNTFPLVSPAAYYAARRAGAAVVQTLHNYRLLCPQATFYRAGGICEDCLGKRIAWPGIRRKCYRDSRAATIAVAGMLATHRALGSWRRKVDAFIALSEFSRGKFIEGGLPAEKILLKPNFVSPDPGASQSAGRYALFLGRLSPEKGVDVLMRAWTELRGDVPLKIVGGGPLADEVQDWASRTPGVEALGRVSSEAVWQILADAAFMALPSTNYEGFPKTIVEAFSCGVPVLASRLGAMAELIDPGRTGEHFEAGNASDLARRARRLFFSPDQLAPMRTAARREYLQKYTAEPNYQTLMGIYDKALATRHPIEHRPGVNCRSGGFQPPLITEEDGG